MSDENRPAISIPPSWQRAAQLILSQRHRRVLLLGETDRGKSTFCAYLTAFLLKEGFRVAYLDADPGQKVFGPPATLTLGYPKLDEPLSGLKPEALYFIGDTSPRGNLLPMVVGLQYLADRAEIAPFFIVNTCGYLHEAGVVLKSYEIEVLRPDVIVALQKAGEIEPLLKAYRHFLILRLESPPQVQSRSFEERRQNRLAAFRRHFRTARRQPVPLKRLILQRVFEMSLEEALMRGRLCAVANLKQEVLSLAIIERFEAKSERLWLKSTVSLSERQEAHLEHFSSKECFCRSPEMAVLQVGRILLPELLTQPTSLRGA